MVVVGGVGWGWESVCMEEGFGRGETIYSHSVPVSVCVGLCVYLCVGCDFFLTMREGV